MKLRKNHKHHFNNWVKTTNIVTGQVKEKRHCEDCFFEEERILTPTDKGRVDS